MKLFKHTISILIFIFLASSCQEEVFLNETIEMHRMTPKSLGPYNFIQNTKNNSDDIEYRWDSVDGAEYDFRLFLNNKLEAEFNSLDGTRATVQLHLNSEDIIRAEVRTSYDGGRSISKWISHETINGNDISRGAGGSAVSQVPRIADWRAICDYSICDGSFFTFIDDELEDCNGKTISFDFSQGKGNYYDREQVCDCLASYDSICEGAANIKDCLNTSYLKRNYDTCQ